MQLRILKYFLIVAREESFSKAAEVLHLTQPTLNRQITQLEEDLGVKLFERSKQRILLTKQGQLYRRRAEEAVLIMNKAEEELFQEEDTLEGTISFGCGEFMCNTILADAIMEFSQKYPLVKFEIFTGIADTVKERMEHGLADIGIFMEPVDVDKYSFIRFRKPEKWIVSMRADDPLSTKPYITKDDLLDKPLIMTWRAKLRKEIANWFGVDYERLNVKMNVNLNGNSILFAIKGFGYCITLEGAHKLHNCPELVFKELYPPLTSRCVLAWTKDQPLNIALQKFLEFFKEYLARTGN